MHSTTAFPIRMLWTTKFKLRPLRSPSPMDNYWFGNMFYDQHPNEDDEVNMFAGMQGFGQDITLQGNAPSQPLDAMSGQQGRLPVQGQRMNSSGSISPAHPSVHAYGAQHAAYHTNSQPPPTSSRPYNQYYSDQARSHQPLQHLNPSFPTLHSSTVPRSHTAWASTPQTFANPMTIHGLGGTPQPGSREANELPPFFNQNVRHPSTIGANAIHGAYPTQRLSHNNGQNFAFTPVPSLEHMGYGGFDPSTPLHAFARPQEFGPMDHGALTPPSSDIRDRPSAERTASTAQTFTCEIDGCGSSLPVDKVLYERHLLTSHGYGSAKRGRAVECRWTDCACTRQSQCKGRDAGHGWHGESVLEHIWEVHLAFQDPCPQCGDVRWQHQFSKERHAKTCPGRKPARCRGCATLFGSYVALGGHLELGQCVRSGASVEVVG